MTKKSYHVVPSKKNLGWTVKKSGSRRASGKFKLKDDAIKLGREISKRQHSELYIHKKDGSIQNRSSYGNDPFPPRDRVK